MLCVLKNAVYQVAAKRRAGTEDGSITQFLTDLLPRFVHLARRAALRPTRTASPGGDGHRRDVRVIRVLALRRRGVGAARADGGWRGVSRLPARLGLVGWLGGRRGVVAGLFAAAVVDLHVALGEDALGAGPLVAAHPPVVVHVLVHGDLVVPLEGQVAVVGGLIPVEGAGAGDDGLRWRLRRRRRGVVARRETGRARSVVGRRSRVRRWVLVKG